MLTQSAVVLAGIALVIGLGLFIGGATDKVPAWCIPVGLLFMLGAVASIVFALHVAAQYGVVQ